MTAGTAKRNTVAILVPRAVWENAPEVRASQLTELNNASHAQQISQHYRPPADSTSEIADASATASEAGESLTPTGREPERRNKPEPAALTLAGELLGRPIVNRQNERLGEILDFLLRFDSEGQAFVIFSAGKMLRNHHDEFAASIRSLSIQNRKIVLDAARSALEGAPPFDEHAWSEASATTAPQIFSYSKQR
jgi:hypothetical protein